MALTALQQKSVTAFLDELASAAPAPGGGSVAALGGALGASLVSMVCNLTIGRKKYADVESEMQRMLQRAEALRGELTGLLEADVEAFMKFSSAMKLPRETEEQQVARRQAVQSTLKEATAVPMRVAELCREVIALCRPTAEMGNLNAVSDAGVAVLVAEAALRSAALSVLINLGSIDDQAFKAEQHARLTALLNGQSVVKENVYQLVVSKL